MAKAAITATPAAMAATVVLYDRSLKALGPPSIPSPPAP